MRSATVTLVVAVAAAALTGCSSAGTTPGGQPSVLTTSAPRPTPVPSAFSTEVPQQTATIPPVRRAAAPTTITVDHAGITAPVRPEGVDEDGAMALPPDPATAGWYRFGAAPSSDEGTVVIAAHVDAVGYGVGPFARLRGAPSGTRVTITDTAGAETTWRIDSVSMLEKQGLAWGDVFRADGPRRLVLVTCGGTFDAATGHYESNLVVTAVPV
ncbi:class F sortase [Curtobacterium aurantiacum]|uniref:class F sortase n=1 Tax=Curtobacterium aurantiacum TaxID=3236919 RepID=UPI001BDFE5BD|nr:class F sortase [Curtobacterium flaccumfaciens]MBT1676708.1 class F sortase [Curtobacterium flaccumfaciens pv. flaccumfaciens]